MPDLNYIYNNQAGQYQRLVDYEDHESNLLNAIQEIASLKDIDVLETGAGTGRVTCLLAPHARSIRAFDLSGHMLNIARSRVKSLGYENVQFAVGNHGRLPAGEASADLVISGWSVHCVYLGGGSEWRDALDKTLADFQRFLRPGGKIVLIETLGTGYQEPVRYPSIVEYLDYLDEVGFRMNWIRTDFRFENMVVARELTQFFFGDEILEKLEGLILPECTGLWWMDKQ